MCARWCWQGRWALLLAVVSLVLVRLRPRNPRLGGSNRSLASRRYMSRAVESVGSTASTAIESREEGQGQAVELSGLGSTCDLTSAGLMTAGDGSGRLHVAERLRWMVTINECAAWDEGQLRRKQYLPSIVKIANRCGSNVPETAESWARHRFGVDMCGEKQHQQPLAHRMDIKLIYLQEGRKKDTFVDHDTHYFHSSLISTFSSLPSPSFEQPAIPRLASTQNT